MAIKIGDIVGFAKPFLRSIRAAATDPIWFERGKVEAIKEYPLKGSDSKRVMYVRGFTTENDDGLAHVLESNIAVVGSFKHVEMERN